MNIMEHSMKKSLNIKIFKILVVLLIIVFLIYLTLFIYKFMKQENLKCSINVSQIKYTKKSEFDIILKNNKIQSMKENVSYIYNKGYLDDATDMYDNINSFYKIIKEKNGIKTFLEQKNHNIIYSLQLDIKEINKNNYKLLEIEDIIKLKEKKDIIKYYEKQGYTCK